MQNPLLDLFNTLIQLATSIVGGTMLWRFWTQLAWVRPPEQLRRFMHTVTDWWVLRVRRVLPARGKLDFASLLGALFVALAGQLVALLFSMLLVGALPGYLNTSGDLALFATVMSLGTFLLVALYQVWVWFYYGAMALLILGAIMSWINPDAPLAPYVEAMCRPLLSPVRRILPLIAGIDFSPLVVLLLLQFMNRLAKMFLMILLSGDVGSHAIDLI